MEDLGSTKGVTLQKQKLQPQTGKWEISTTKRHQQCRITKKAIPQRRGINLTRSNSIQGNHKSQDYK